jgi:BMFP domain-containing protein YqiC|tara:strand:+ start:25 stop:600 length:576 start_codon:yes stop_codon:yes gene_type:complete
MATNFGIAMAEMEFAGLKFKGGKIFVVLTALTTLGGGLWGGFEFYKDYLNMKEQIQNYVAPDLSEFDKNIALTKEQMESKTELIQTEVEMIMQEMEMMMSEIRLVSDVANELKNDLRQDVRRVEKIVNDVEQQVKEDGRDNSKDLKIAIDTVEEDMTKLKTNLEEKMKELQESIDKQIKLTLANPLAQMTK